MNVNRDDSAFVAFLVRLNMVIEKIPKMIKEKYGQGDIKLQFVLSNRGMHIIHQGRRFICRDGEVEQQRSQQIVCGNHEVNNF